MNFTIQTDNLRGARTPLFCKYHGIEKPQPAYVQVDRKDYVSASYDSQIGDAVPPSVYFGFDIRIPCPSGVDGDALEIYLGSPEFIAGLERIRSGHAIEPFSNHCSLTDDAQSALTEIEQALKELKQWDVWTLDTFLDASDMDPTDVTLAGSVDALVKFWRGAIDQALDLGVSVVGDDDELRKALIDRYERLIQDAAERAAFPDHAQRAAEIIGYTIKDFDED